MDIKFAKLFIEKGANLQIVDDEGRNLLHWAVIKRKLKLVKKLLKENLIRKNQAFAPDKASKSPLDYAKEMYDREDFAEIQEYYNTYEYNVQYVMSSASVLGLSSLNTSKAAPEKKSSRGSRTQKGSWIISALANPSEGSNKEKVKGSGLEKEKGRERLVKDTQAKVQDLLADLRSQLLTRLEYRNPSNFLRIDLDSISAISKLLLIDPEFASFRSHLDQSMSAFVKQPGVCILDELVSSGADSPKAKSESNPSDLLVAIAKGPIAKAASFSEYHPRIRFRIASKESPKGSPKEENKDTSERSPRMESPGRIPRDMMVYTKVFECERVVTSLLEHISVLIKAAPPSFKQVFQGVEQITLDAFPGEDRFAKEITISFLFLRLIAPRLTVNGVVTQKDPELKEASLRVVKALLSFVDRGDEGKEDFMGPMRPFFKRNENLSPFVPSAVGALESIYQSLALEARFALKDIKTVSDKTPPTTPNETEVEIGK
jgi:hypothetical protein